MQRQDKVIKNEVKRDKVAKLQSFKSGLNRLLRENVRNEGKI